MKIDVNKILDAIKTISDFNKLDFYDGDKKIDIPREVLKEYKWLANPNESFVKFKMWENPKYFWHNSSDLWFTS